MSDAPTTWGLPACCGEPWFTEELAVHIRKLGFVATPYLRDGPRQYPLDMTIPVEAVRMVGFYNGSHTRIVSIVCDKYGIASSGATKKFECSSPMGMEKFQPLIDAIKQCLFNLKSKEEGLIRSASYLIKQYDRFAHVLSGEVVDFEGERSIEV